MDAKCPYCGHVNDFDVEFSEFIDCGDYVLGTGWIECACGESLRVQATFNWDGNIQIS